MNGKIKSRLKLFVISFGVLGLVSGISFIDGLRGVFVLAWAGGFMSVLVGIACLVGIIFNRKIFTLSVTAAHVIGICLGLIFNKMVPDGGGDMNPNGWIYYGHTMLIVAFIAIIVEIVFLIIQIRKALKKKAEQK